MTSEVGACRCAVILSIAEQYVRTHVQKKKREEDAAAAVEEVDAEAEADAEAPPKKKKVRAFRALPCQLDMM